MECSYYLVTTQSLKKANDEILYIFELQDDDVLENVFNDIKKKLPFTNSEYHRIVEVFKLEKPKIPEERFSSKIEKIDLDMINFEKTRLDNFLISHKFHTIHFYIRKTHGITSKYEYKYMNFPVSEISIDKIQNDIFGICIYNDKFSKKLTDSSTNKIKLLMLNNDINFSVSSIDAIYSNINGYKNITNDNDFVIVFYSINMDDIISIIKEFISHSERNIYFYYVNTKVNEIYEIILSDKLEMKLINYI